MNRTHLIQLMLLAAIWGASFLFMRIGAPSFGPAVMIELRVGVAALFLWGVARFMKSQLQWRGQWKSYLVLGLFNVAIPFTKCERKAPSF